MATTDPDPSLLLLGLTVYLVGVALILGGSAIEPGEAWPVPVVGACCCGDRLGASRGGTPLGGR